jgi:hypothetical protein
MTINASEMCEITENPFLKYEYLISAAIHFHYFQKLSENERKGRQKITTVICKTRFACWSGNRFSGGFRGFSSSHQMNAERAP